MLSDRQTLNVAITQVQRCLSFRQVLISTQDFQSSATRLYLSNVSEGGVSVFVQSLCRMYFQVISTALRAPSVSAFSAAFSGTKISSSSYIDVFVRMYDSFPLRNFQVLAIPIYWKHTGEDIFNFNLNSSAEYGW